MDYLPLEIKYMILENVNFENRIVCSEWKEIIDIKNKREIKRISLVLEIIKNGNIAKRIYTMCENLKKKFTDKFWIREFNIHNFDIGCILIKLHNYCTIKYCCNYFIPSDIKIIHDFICDRKTCNEYMKLTRNLLNENREEIHDIFFLKSYAEKILRERIIVKNLDYKLDYTLICLDENYDLISDQNIFTRLQYIHDSFYIIHNLERYKLDEIKCQNIDYLKDIVKVLL